MTKEKLVVLNKILLASIPAFIFIFLVTVMGFESPRYFGNKQISNFIIFMEFYPVVAVVTLVSSFILMKFNRYNVAATIFILPVLDIFLLIIVFIAAVSNLK